MTSPPFGVSLENHPLEVRIIIAAPHQAEEVGILLLHQPNSADRKVGSLRGLHGSVPADDDHVVGSLVRWALVIFEPFPFDQVALRRDRLLQILSRKLYRSHCRLQPSQDFPWFPAGIEQITWLASFELSVSQGNSLSGFSNRRDIEVVPATFLQQDADKVIDVEALHDHNDRVFAFEIEA